MNRTCGHGRVRCLCLIALWVMGLVVVASAGEAVLPRLQEIDGVKYQVLKAAPESVRVVWKDEQGNGLERLPGAAAYLKRQGMTPLAIVNGGIFEPGCIPSGLLVQDAKVLRPLNLREGEGNFYLKPNGVFLIGSKGAAVIAATEYPPAGVEVRYAVQSGPLLLRHGRVHPAFNPQSESRLHRNGVGVTADGQVLLLISDFHSPRFPNLHDFAMAFKSLGCQDALFLDGDISQMRWGEALAKPGNRFASMIAVVEKRDAE